MSHADDLLTAAPTHPEAAPQRLIGVTVPSFVLTVGLTFATYLIIQPLGFMHLVPPVPALMLLLLLVGVNQILGLIARSERAARFIRPLARGELLLVYVALSIAPVMDRGVYVLHYLLYPIYYGNDVNQWQEFAQYYAPFQIPLDPIFARGFFEGSTTGLIPWDAWRWPVAYWLSFNLLVVLATSCLVAYFRRQWVEAERLRYPLLFLPLEITGGFEGSAVQRGFFFRDPLMWLGLIFAALFNGARIVHEMYPAFPEVKHYIQLGTGLAEVPWRWIRPLNLHLIMDVWGLSYLMPGDVLLTSWLSYFIMKTVKIVGLQAGYRKPRYPFYQEVSSGACVSVFITMIYVARRHFRRVIGRVVRGPGEYDRNEPMSYRLLTIVFFLSTAGMIWMLLRAGHRLDLLIIYFAVLYMFVTVTARIRAEAGPPVPWTHPYGFDTEMPTHLLGNAFLRGYGPLTGIVQFYSLFYIGRTVFAHSAGQYFTDGYRLIDYGNAKRSSALKLMLLALLIAGFLAFANHLKIGYRYGQAFYYAPEGREHRTWAQNWSSYNYRLLDAGTEKPAGPDRARSVAYAAGLVGTGAITWARLNTSSFPLHPLGIVMGTLYNDGSPYWAPFLIAWLGQQLALRYGGLPAYRRMVPFFLGLFFGHTVVGNVVRPMIIRLGVGD